MQWSAPDAPPLPENARHTIHVHRKLSAEEMYISYEKNDVAVVKITVKTNDFSKVDDAYEDAAYKYIMDNLGTDKVSDTEKLNAKCVELYVKQFEKAAKGEADKETTAFVTMISDRHHGWNVILTDELMKAVLGDVDLPVKQKADK